jgi:hypothetical protein
LPPFRALFANQEGHLFVLTFEPAENEGEYMIDVFNPDGVFTGRLSADIFTSLSTPLAALVRAGRMYFIREKTDGYQQLVVEKILYE